ncbi:MAG TPA: PepSY domain-containing protein [Roseiarcus sp.]|nr:PepSY domain-containing protein [Roseiarcus sp.]
MKSTASKGAGLIGLAAIAAMLGGPALAYTGQQFARQAKVSIEQARQIALKAHPGRITDEELEREGGGSGLRYSFDIKSGPIT